MPLFTREEKTCKLAFLFFTGFQVHCTQLHKPTQISPGVQSCKAMWYQWENPAPHHSRGSLFQLLLFQRTFPKFLTGSLVREKWFLNRLSQNGKVRPALSGMYHVRCDFPSIPPQPPISKKPSLPQYHFLRKWSGKSDILHHSHIYHYHIASAN